MWISHELKTVASMSTHNAVKAGSSVITRTKFGNFKVVGKLSKLKHNLVFVDVKDVRMRLVDRGMIEVLKNPPAGIQVVWVKGKAGQSVPVGAIISGQAVDGNPLYVVKIGTTPGYYDSSKKCARIYPGRVKCPTDFEYLTFIGPGKTYSDFYDSFFDCIHRHQAHFFLTVKFLGRITTSYFQGRSTLHVICIQ